ADDGHQHGREAPIGSRMMRDGEIRSAEHARCPTGHERIPSLDRKRAVGQVDANAVLELVKVADGSLLVVEPPDADVSGLQHLAQLVADEVDDGVEVEL